jgi:hypothetical protein
MGANLSLGRVCGENIVCGMHGFEFDGEGQCVKLAYGTRPPPKARLTLYPVHEIDGFIYGYYAPDGEQPTWRVEPLDWDGWTALRHQRLEFVGHPQEITENSVDIGHFNAIHYYTASVENDPVVHAERLTAAYRVVRPWFGKRFQKPTFEVKFRVLAHGLGYSLVRADVQRTPISIRYFINAIAIDGERTHLNLAAAIRKTGVPGLDWIIRESVFQGLKHDVSQDIPYWESKHHIDRPMLAEGDGPIPIYRDWCNQFYPARSIAERSGSMGRDRSAPSPSADARDGGAPRTSARTSTQHPRLAPAAGIASGGCLSMSVRVLLPRIPY